MRNVALIAAIAVALVSCGGESKETGGPRMSRQPVSVRGWIADVEGAAATNTFRTVETESSRRIQLFQNTSVWVENAPFVSGGVAETGAFIVLDVPPGNVTISFNAPGAETARLVLQNIPGNADVFIPGLILTKNGTSVEDPKGIRVRLASKVAKTTPTNLTATVAGAPVPVVEVPLGAMEDRRNYPDPPVGYTPMAKVK
jgi:hypothetical protein